MTAKSVYWLEHRKQSSAFFNKDKAVSLVVQSIWITFCVLPGKIWGNLFKNNIWICIHTDVYT